MPLMRTRSKWVYTSSADTSALPSAPSLRPVTCVRSATPQHVYSCLLTTLPARSVLHHGCSEMSGRMSSDCDVEVSAALAAHGPCVHPVCSTHMYKPVGYCPAMLAVMLLMAVVLAHLLTDSDKLQPLRRLSALQPSVQHP